MYTNQAEFKSALTGLVKQKLIDAKLIQRNDDIYLTTCHSIRIEQNWYCHYFLQSRIENKKFFLKALKPGEGLMHCNRYLRMFKNHLVGNVYPEILVPPFEFYDIKYFITSFFDAHNLDELVGQLSVLEWRSIGDKIFARLQELEQLHAIRYSDRGKFILQSYEMLFMDKLRKRFRHDVVNSLSKVTLERVCARCESILQSSIFSVPTLLHMDIKPANILYNPHTQKIFLIDFEFARFGDLDYGWTQVLLSGLNAFSSVYKEHVYPNIVKHKFNLESALQIPKIQCYVLYQTLCNMIYYHDQDSSCPCDLEKLFYRTLEHFT